MTTETQIAVDTDTPNYPFAYGNMILAGPQHKSHVYQGTVDPVTVSERRARNRVARKSRRINRGRR